MLLTRQLAKKRREVGAKKIEIFAGNNYQNDEMSELNYLEISMIEEIKKMPINYQNMHILCFDMYPYRDDVVAIFNADENNNIITGNLNVLERRFREMCENVVIVSRFNRIKKDHFELAQKHFVNVHKWFLMAERDTLTDKPIYAQMLFGKLNVYVPLRDHQRIMREFKGLVDGHWIHPNWKYYVFRFCERDLLKIKPMLEFLYEDVTYIEENIILFINSLVFE